jgi:hypothetical protein
LHVTILDTVNKYLPNYQLPAIELIRGVPLLTFKDGVNKLQIMFILNSGSFRNQLGYFLVSASNPNHITKEELVFYDSSKECIKTGDFVTVGPFKPDDMIGFYLVSDGWCGGQDKVYTFPGFNNNSAILTSVFFDNASSTLIIGMEDKPGKPGDDYQDVVFQVDSDPMLLREDFLGDVPFICSLSCDNCNYTTGSCIFNRSRYSRSVGIILAITFGLAFLLIIAIGVIIYLVRVKSIGRGVLPEGWFPVSNSLADQLQIEDNKEEEFDKEDNI